MRTGAGDGVMLYVYHALIGHQVRVVSGMTLLDEEKTMVQPIDHALATEERVAGKRCWATELVWQRTVRSVGWVQAVGGVAAKVVVT